MPEEFTTHPLTEWAAGTAHGTVALLRINTLRDDAHRSAFAAGQEPADTIVISLSPMQARLLAADLLTVAAKLLAQAPPLRSDQH